MKKYSTTIIILFFLAPTCCQGQYQDNPKELLKKLQIKSLLVTTDSLQNGCPVDYFEYDSSGRPVYFQWGPAEDRTEIVYSGNSEKLLIRYGIGDDGIKYDFDTTFYYYYQNNKIKFTRTKSSYQDDDKQKIGIDSTFYFYDKSGKLEYTVFNRYWDNSIKTDTIRIDPEKSRLKNPQYNKLKQLTSHFVNGINRPCLTPSKGDHRINYFYSKNGLIHKITIFTTTNKIYGTWFFIYNDKSCCR